MAHDPTEELVRRAATRVLRMLESDAGKPPTGAAAGFSVPVGVSNRHVHLSPGDMAVLFGPGYELTPRNDLGQPGQYAAEETVTIVGPSGDIAGVRILGPTRPRTQVEILAGDTFALGLPYDTPVGTRMPVTLVGPAGSVEPADGAVVAQRHLHATPADADRYNLSDGITVAAETGVPGRRILFKNVRVRVSPTAALELHLDREEAAACGAKSGDKAFVIKADAATPARSKNTFKTERPGLLTEADVLGAYKAGTVPPTKNIVITPYARDALRKYFPELSKV